MSKACRAERIVSLFLNDIDKKLGDSTWSIIEMPLEKIKPGDDQPRKIFDQQKLESLALSIKEHGVQEPILVRELPGGNYEIIFGERRWRASQIAGRKTIPCRVAAGLEEAEARVLALTENIQRQDLNALEKAMAIKSLMDASRLLDDKDLTLEEVGKILGISKVRVHQYLAVLKLPKSILEEFLESNLNEMHARALMMLKDHTEAQDKLFLDIKKHQLTGQQALDWSKRYLAAQPQKNLITDKVEKFRKTFTVLQKKLSNMDDTEKMMIKKELKTLAGELNELVKNIDIT
ncbi:MAG: putative chromosome-partitioning protein ParB [Pelotomaculum sp. PtaU1.Bin065]|nr:MAG: putative chromosome-partitioning protein ParB [Pelotomaculum sp. PtaU1.Bin065]